MHRDITLIVLFAAMIFLFLCNFMSLGIVGDTLSAIMFGTVGFGGYFLPVFIFGVYLYYMLIADSDSKAPAKTAAVIVLFIIFIVFAHLISGDLKDTSGYDPGSMWQMSSESHHGGGVLGGTIAYVLYRLLKMVGAVLVLLVGAIGCIYVIGQRSFLELFRNKAMDARLAREERLQQEALEAENRREEREENGEPEEEDDITRYREEHARTHYEETRDRYQELHRQRREREAEERARMRRGRAGQNLDVRLVSDEPETAADAGSEGSEPELDAPSIRSGRIAGAAARKEKIQHYRGIVGDTALTEETGDSNAASVQAGLKGSAAAAGADSVSFEAIGFSMPAGFQARPEKDEEETKTTETVGTDASSSDAVASQEQRGYRDSDELHEILPGDFYDEEDPEDGTRNEAAAPEYGNETRTIKATVIHGNDAGFENDTSGSLYRYSVDDADPYADMPDIEELAEEILPEEDISDNTDVMDNAAGPDTLHIENGAANHSDIDLSKKTAGNGDINKTLKNGDVNSRNGQDDKYIASGKGEQVSSAEGAASEPDQIAIHTERESGSSVINQVLDEKNQDQEEAKPVPEKHEYVFPPISLLHPGKKTDSDSDEELRHTAMVLQTTLQNFGVNVTITDISQGPAVTRYEMLPEMGVKVSKIVSLADDIKLALAATDIRIEAPIPGKSAIGIEVPNREAESVALRDIIDTDEFRAQKSKIAFAVGKDIAGKPVYGDIAKMPHVLIAGATGSGKSVCINTIIMSILYHAKPDEVKLIMIDPKVVELSVYNGIPHLLIPVVTNPQKAAAALNWGVAEMEARYRHFADAKVRDIKAYNAEAKRAEASGNNPDGLHFMPQIVIIVDELADLMMVAKNDVETAICRLAQLARAAGIYLIIATQRPSVDVITGLIKANMPSRIAFRVTSGVDSRTILDMNGAEKLLGKGDMLFFPQGLPKPTRVQGCFVSDEEVNDVVRFITSNNASLDEETKKHQAEIDAIASGNANPSAGGAAANAADTEPEQDELFGAAGIFIIEKNNASIGILQRRYRIGFNRAARIMDQLCDAGVVSDSEGTKSRNILMTMEQFLSYCHDNGIPVPDDK